MVASDGFVAPNRKVNKSKSLMKFSNMAYGPKLFDMLSREVDIVLGRQIDLFEKNVSNRLEMTAAAVNRVESNIAAVLAHHETIAAESEMRALELVDEERGEKKVLCQWLNGFLAASSHQLKLDPIDFAFARFSLNMAIAAPDTPVEVMLNARVPGFLVGMLSSTNDVVLGPAAIALSHLALLPDARVPICDQGAIAPLVHQCRTCKSPAVVTQICRTMAALACGSENRQRVAGEGGTAAICELISEATEFMDYPRCTNGARAAAMTALVNFTYQSDANKKLLVETRGLAPIIDAAVNSPDSEVVLQSIRCLGNICFNQPYCSAAVVTNRGVDAIVAALDASDLLVDVDIFDAALTALCNLCNNEQNQTNVGASRACSLAIHASRHSNEASVILVACRLLTALSFSSFVNKTRLGEAGAIDVTLDIFRRYGFGDLDYASHYSSAVAWACKALASLLLHRGNQMFFRDCFGIQIVVDMLLETEQLEVMNGAAMVLAAVTPTAEERFDARDEGRTIQVEQVRTFDALNRAKNVLYGHTDDCPEWLQTAWEVMGYDDTQLQSEKTKAAKQGERMEPLLKEFILRLSLFEEKESVVYPDPVVTSSEQLRSLLYKAY